MALDYFSSWPILIVLALLFALAATPIFKLADAPPIPAGKRVSTLDGLRGFLALAVFFHHGAIYHNYAQGQPWRPPADRLYALLGPFGVSLFFMITGFLFWSQLIDKNGKPGWAKLYLGRFFRLGPLYLAALAAVIFGAFAFTHFRLQQSPREIAVEIVKWLPLGVRIGPPINGFVQTSNLIGVIWSLRYEWLFYGSLFFTSIFSRRRLTAWVAPALVLAGTLAILVLPAPARLEKEAPFVALFCVGMLTGALREVVPSDWFQNPLASGATTIVLVIVLVLFDTAYTIAPICLLGLAFFLIANGVSLFGLLNTTPARRLGNISFGIYLLQLLVLAAAFATPSVRIYAVSSPIGHWSIIAAAGVAVIVVATLAHAFIERPGIDFGRYMTRRLGL